MNINHLIHIRCPKTLRKLELHDEVYENGKVKAGWLREPKSGNSYEIRNFIPRFVSPENYAENFGLQWNIHNRTQYDDTSGAGITKERFEAETKWEKDLSGQIILEAGSGSGRFTQHAANTNGFVITFDYSNAVEAVYKSNGHRDNVLVLQASIFEMPFEKNYFDKVFCFGVLQHTPDPKLAFMLLIEMLKKGGKIACDIYIKNITHWVFGTKYYVRPFIKNIEPQKLYSLVERYVNFIWPLARLISKIPKIGYAINWRLLVADYSTILPGATSDQLKEWAILDTFDMLSPRYDLPVTVATFRSWHKEANLKEIDVHKGYNGVEGRGTKPL